MLLIKGDSIRLFALSIVRGALLGFVVISAAMASEGSAQGDDGPLKHLHEVRNPALSWCAFHCAYKTQAAAYPKPWKWLGCLHIPSLMPILLHFGLLIAPTSLQDGPVRTADNTHNQSLHAEQTADKAEPDSMPSTGQAVPKEEDSVKADDQDASIQSPASTLAETLSLLSLSTPAAVEYKSSRLGQNGQQKEDDDGNHASSQTASQTRGTPDQSDAPRILVRKPAKPQEGDVSVGLVYDAIMEEHRGPPGDTIQRTF